MPIPTPPRRFSPDVFTRETFHAYARGDTRQEVMDAMRAQAEDYFECRVTLRDAAAQPAPDRSGARWQGSSRWIVRPGGAA